MQHGRPDDKAGCQRSRASTEEGRPQQNVDRATRQLGLSQPRCQTSGLFRESNVTVVQAKKRNRCVMALADAKIDAETEGVQEGAHEVKADAVDARVTTKKVSCVVHQKCEVYHYKFCMYG